MQRFLQLFPLWLLLMALPAGAGPPPLLPSSFSGWQRTEHHTGTTPAQVDAVNAAALSEFGFTDYELVTYERSGRKLHIKAARFTNATGSYGAFTLFTQPDMIAEQIGDGALVSNGHILFYKADVLVDAAFEKPTIMSAAELRALSDNLQTVSGGAASLPEPVKYLPSQSYVPGSSHYAVGPATFSRMDPILPADLVGFDKSAEVASGDYRTGSGMARLIILSYPTPQIAMQHFRALLDWLSPTKDPATSQQHDNARIEEARKPSFQGTLTLPLNTGSEVTLRRSGPLVILVSGSISKSEAISLVQSVNYDADVRMLQPTPVTISGLTKLIVGCFILIALLIAVFLVMGLFVGGAPFLLRRLFPNREFKHAQDIEIIKLNLRD